MHGNLKLRVITTVQPSLHIKDPNMIRKLAVFQAGSSSEYFSFDFKPDLAHAPLDLRAGGLTPLSQSHTSEETP